MIEAREAEMPAIRGPWKLPQGWSWVTIGSVCTINPLRPKLTRAMHTPTSFVPMAGVDEKNGVIRRLETKLYRQVARGFTYFEENDVLFAKITPSMENGKCAIAHNLIDGLGFGSTEFHVIRPGPRITPHWLYYFLRRRVFRLDAREHFTGAVGQQRVPDDFISASLIPLPGSIDLQNYLADRIEALLADLKNAQATLSTMRRDIDHVMESVLYEVFEDSSQISDWDEKYISELCYQPQYGYTESASLEPIGPKFVRITDIQNDTVNWDTVPYCPISQERFPIYQLQPGDILFARTGATTGKTFLVRECPPAIFASYLIRLRVKKAILPELLGWFFKSELYWSQVRPRGGAQPNMNATLLKKVRVRYPPSRQAQQHLVGYLDSIQDEVSRMQNTLKENDDILQQVEQAILNEAFRGKL